MKTTLKKNVKAGFSLVEMLVVIAVIGIIAAIAVPTIGSITSQANTNKAKRNAQNLASVYSSAIAAGATDFTADTTAAGIVTKLIAGVNGADSFETTNFQVPNMSGDEQTNALGYLVFGAAAGTGEQPQLNYQSAP
ncbi:MAG: prepilin-type N-terminal cleavage/methylation domain-containing protein [Verrucomicrobiales bacterium]